MRDNAIYLQKNSVSALELNSFKCLG
uniref:Uncharacterized protein n=1 Tax=Rhizophora mucronata TaxID=61149 RepID=A0A2P2PWL3_RHIMU